MVALGIVPGDAPLELIGGELIEMSPQGSYHSVVCEGLGERLRSVLGDGFRVREDKPLVAGNYSMPEPDIAVVPGPRRRWRERHPRADEVLLVVEVSLTTQDIDRAKTQVYAAAGAPVYWQLDLEARTLRLHESPGPEGFSRERLLAEHETVAVPGTSTAWTVAELVA